MPRKASESAKGLIVDWGGVHKTPVRDSFEIWMLREGIETRSFIVAMRRMHNQTDSELHRVERGDADRSVFETALARDLERTDGSLSRLADRNPVECVGNGV